MKGALDKTEIANASCVGMFPSKQEGMSFPRDVVSAFQGQSSASDTFWVPASWLLRYPNRRALGTCISTTKLRVEREVFEDTLRSLADRIGQARSCPHSDSVKTEKASQSSLAPLARFS